MRFKCSHGNTGLKVILSEVFSPKSRRRRSFKVRLLILCPQCAGVQIERSGRKLNAQQIQQLYDQSIRKHKTSDRIQQELDAYQPASDQEYVSGSEKSSEEDRSGIFLNGLQICFQSSSNQFWYHNWNEYFLGGRDSEATENNDEDDVPLNEESSDKEKSADNTRRKVPAAAQSENSSNEESEKNSDKIRLIFQKCFNFIFQNKSN